MTSLPDVQRLYQVVDHTWPAYSFVPFKGWMLRDGAGAGKRASAATQIDAGADIAVAERAMENLDQSALFMIRDGDDALDAQLAEAGYRMIDPVTLYACPIEVLLPQEPLPAAHTYDVWPPVHIMREIWERGGINDARVALMDRAPAPKTALLGRADNAPVGTGFVGIDNDIAMVHALEVLSDFRNKGVARMMMHHAARWAQRNGAAVMSLVTTDANAAANALYHAMGMTKIGHYHYRLKETS